MDRSVFSFDNFYVKHEKKPDYLKSGNSAILLHKGPVAFRPHFTMSLAISSLILGVAIAP